MQHLTPTASALLLVQAANRIRRLSDESFSDDEWRQQQSELQSTLTQCDSDLATASVRLGLGDEASLEQALPGEAVSSELNRLLEEEQRLSSRLKHVQSREALLVSRRAVLDSAQRLGISSAHISALDLPEPAWPTILPGSHIQRLSMTSRHRLFFRKVPASSKDIHTGTMAEKGRVLYLMNHQHLLDIAHGVIGQDRVTVHYFQ